MAGMATASRGRVTMQEHMAIDVSPGPIRPIRLISDYFPHFYPFAEPALRTPDPRPAVTPAIPSAPQPQLDLEPEGDSDDSSKWGGGGRRKGCPWLPTRDGQGRRPGAGAGAEVEADHARPPAPPSAALGTLEFTLLLDADNSTLHCTAHRAEVRMGRRPWAPGLDPGPFPHPLPLSRASSHQPQAPWTPTSRPICSRGPAR